MRKPVLALVAAVGLLAALPAVTAQAEPAFVPAQYGSGHGPRHDWRDHDRHDAWRPGHRFGWHPWWLKRHRFEHDYGWYRGPYYRR